MEFSLSGKWLELVMEISPGATHAAILRDATQAFATSQFAAIQAVAPSLKMEVKPIDMRDAQGIENSLAAFARSPNGGLVVTASGAGIRYRDLIVSTAARYKLPTVYFDRAIVAAGGLVSYGADLIEQYRLAARYVDRILRGEKPADLPVQAPTKYETVINLKTAKALSLVVPQTLLARADEVIE
jgi:putative ABC transport system substrate-binding protein